MVRAWDLFWVFSNFISHWAGGCGDPDTGGVGDLQRNFSPWRADGGLQQDRCPLQCCSAADVLQCTVKHHTDIINFACMTWNFVRIPASLSALCTNFYLFDIGIAFLAKFYPILM